MTELIDSTPRVYKENGETYYPDTCTSLTSAWKEGKLQLDALARYNYPGHQLEDASIPGINTIGYWDAQSRQEWGLDWHRNEGIEITFLETGTMPFSMTCGDYLMLPNDLTITRPWQLHKVGNPTIGVGKLHWLIIDVKITQPHQDWIWPSWIMLSDNDLQELTKMLRQNEQPIFSANAEIRKCFQKIGQHIHVNGLADYESWIRIYVNELLMLIYELLKRGKFVLNESLTDSVRTVELFTRELRNKYEKPWTVESMASYTGLGVTRFTHYFKQLTNQTPMQYLNTLRLDAAAKLLEDDPRLTISDVCYGCGFNSTQYFSTVFFKRFGCSPSAYR
jgi:AraC-like DNA-binding protein